MQSWNCTAKTRNSYLGLVLAIRIGLGVVGSVSIPTLFCTILGLHKFPTLGRTYIMLIKIIANTSHIYSLLLHCNLIEIECKWKLSQKLEKSLYSIKFHDSFFFNIVHVILGTMCHFCVFTFTNNFRSWKTWKIATHKNILLHGTLNCHCIFVSKTLMSSVRTISILIVPTH